MIILIIIVFITLLISGMCSLFEATLYSTRIGTLEAVRKKGGKFHLINKIIQMKKNIATPIAAILILNTIANTVGATISGMYASKILGQSWVPLFSIIFTIGILFFSEIFPKTLGAVHWRKFWSKIVWPLTIMKLGLYPVIKIIQIFSKLIIGKAPVNKITEDEILATVRLGEAAGEISTDESRIIENLICMEYKKAKDIMTPRPVIFSLDENLTIEKAYKMADKEKLTRIPVFNNDRENITGYVMLQELSSAYNKNNKHKLLKDIRKTIVYIDEDTNCLKLFTSFLQSRIHIAVLKDQYHGLSGIVTLEDLFETLTGIEIVDELDHYVNLQEIARNRGGKRKNKKNKD